jgi:hypothetical protein
MMSSSLICGPEKTLGGNSLMSTGLSILLSHSQQETMRMVLAWATKDSEFSDLSIDVRDVGASVARREDWFGAIRACEIWGLIIATKHTVKRDAADLATMIQRRLDAEKPEQTVEVVAPSPKRQPSLFE